MQRFITDTNFEHLAIVGTGGFAKEVLCLALDILGGLDAARGRVTFYELAEHLAEREIFGFPVEPMGELDFAENWVSVAIGEPSLRQRIVEKELEGACFASLVHPMAVRSSFIEIGEGAIICAGAILTCDIVIGKHAHIDRHSDIGHDCRIGDFFRMAPGASISGHCTIGDRVYFGTNACIRQGLRVVDDCTIGMGGVVVKNLEEPGTYVGNPVSILKKTSSATASLDRQ